MRNLAFISILIPFSIFACDGPAEEKVPTPNDESPTSSGSTDSSSGTDSSTSAETSTTEETGAPACADDEEVGGGVYRCGDSGREHQKEPASCELLVPMPCMDTSGTDPFGQPSTCQTDLDCGGSVHATCQQFASADFGSYCGCVPRCETSSDCDAGSTCHCGDLPHGECRPSNCATDSDCGDELCAVSWDACGIHGLYCTTPEDECEGEFGCIYDTDAGKWVEGGADGCP